MQNNSRPNILWITTDHQRYDTVSANGNDEINTPNLDRLCREGVSFRRAYCQSPICTPSRSSFLTGLYPSTINANINGNAYFATGDNVPLITRRLAEAGYDCGLSGKLHIASAWNGVEKRVNDGYRVFYYSHGPTQGRGHGNQYLQWLDDQGVFDEVMETMDVKPGETLPSGTDAKRYRYRKDFPATYHQTTWCADRAIDFIRSEHEGPWLFSCNIFDPHGSHAPLEYERRYDPASLARPLFRESDLEHQNKLKSHFFQRYTGEPGDRQQWFKATFYGMVELIDENVGRMLDALESTGQRESTIVIFHSDHGEMLGDHGLRAKGCRFYEGLTHVPLIISWPQNFKTGLRVEGLTELTDLAPTLAELAGVAAAPSHGISLVPVLTGAASPDGGHEFVRCEFYDTLDRYAPTYPERHHPSYATMYLEGSKKLVVYHGNTYGEYFDLSVDPDEFDNLWDRPECQADKHELMRRSFDATVRATNPGSPRVGRF